MNIIDKFCAYYADLASMKVDELSSIYSDCVVFIDPVAKHKGISSVEHYFESLLHNAEHCTFEIHEKLASSDNSYTVTWTMSFKSSKLNGGEVILVDGVSVIKIADEKIIYHRDYYDLGQMIYENIPVLGRLLSYIKRRIG